MSPQRPAWPLSLTTGLKTIPFALVVALALPVSASADQVAPVKGDGDPLARPSEMFRGTRQALAVPALAAASRPAPLGFGGVTPQGRPFALQVSGDGGTVIKLLVSWRAECSDGDFVTLTTKMPRMPVRSGSFASVRKESQPQSDGTVWNFENAVSGRIASSSLAGTIRMVVTGVKDGEAVFRCDTGVLRLKVPRAYAGETAQRQPFVLKTSNDNRRVTAAVLAWTAACGAGTVGQAALVPLEDGEVDRQGRFSGGATSFGDVGAFGAVILQGIDGGVLSRGKATGTWRAVVAITDKTTGAQVDTCATGPLRVTGIR
jgi:hypothetical protein